MHGKTPVATATSHLISPHVTGVSTHCSHICESLTDIPTVRQGSLSVHDAELPVTPRCDEVCNTGTDNRPSSRFRCTSGTRTFSGSHTPYRLVPRHACGSEKKELSPARSAAGIIEPDVLPRPDADGVPEPLMRQLVHEVDRSLPTLVTCTSRDENGPSTS